jgi:hypothetical protein
MNDIITNVATINTTSSIAEWNNRQAGMSQSQTHSGKQTPDTIRETNGMNM